MNPETKCEGADSLVGTRWLLSRAARAGSTGSGEVGTAGTSPRGWRQAGGEGDLLEAGVSAPPQKAFLGAPEEQVELIPTRPAPETTETTEVSKGTSGLRLSASFRGTLETSFCPRWQIPLQFQPFHQHRVVLSS